jgi:hypothetical protein
VENAGMEGKRVIVYASSLSTASLSSSFSGSSSSECESELSFAGHELFVGDTLNPPECVVGGDDACGMLCKAVNSTAQ